MRTTRLELDSNAGHLTIQIEKGTIRIDSMIRNPKRSQQAWKTWEVPCTSSDDELFAIAQEAQERTDGCRGTNSMIHDYFRELQRFQA